MVCWLFLFAHKNMRKFNKIDIHSTESEQGNTFFPHNIISL